MSTEFAGRNIGSKSTGWSIMWEYIVIGHAVLTIYLVISMYNTLCMGVICDPVVLLEVHHENHL